MKKIHLIGLLSLLLISQISFAGSVVATTKATATLNKTCSVSSQEINFGTLSLNTTSNTYYSNGNVAVLCTKGTSYSIQITFHTPATGSTIYNGNALTGYMTGANTGSVIPYSIQPHPIDNSTVWGSISDVGNGFVQNHTEYGEIQLNAFGVSAFPTPDNYSDIAIATITY
jgi:spore coat protein U-like protein